jgi:hypothetical protein
LGTEVSTSLLTTDRRLFAAGPLIFSAEHEATETYHRTSKKAKNSDTRQ